MKIKGDGVALLPGGAEQVAGGGDLTLKETDTETCTVDGEHLSCALLVRPGVPV